MIQGCNLRVYLAGFYLPPVSIQLSTRRQRQQKHGGKAGNFSGERVGGEEALTLIAFHGTGIFTYSFTIKINHSFR